MRLRDSLWRSRALVLLILLAAVVPATQAEVRRLEVVGAVALHGQGHPKDTPKDRAVQEGLINGVSRVGADLLLEGLLMQGEPQDKSAESGALPNLLAGTELAWESPVSLFRPAQELEMERVHEALGRNMVPYTSGFRILEDQGERPALFTQHPDAATEYVVVMEVQVEVERVRSRLEAMGLIDSPQVDVLTGIELELSGLTEYALYRAVLDLLTGPGIQASSVVPEAFQARNARLRVTGAWTASELNDLLHSAAPDELNLVPLEVQDAEKPETLWPWQGPLRPRLALAVSWTPPSEPASQAAADNPVPVPLSEANGREAHPAP